MHKKEGFLKIFINMKAKDYSERAYLSAVEAAKFLKISVKDLHQLVKAGKIKAITAASGQKRFDIKEIEKAEKELRLEKRLEASSDWKVENILEINGTIQKIYIKSSTKMEEVPNDSVHLVVTSPPILIQNYMQGNH